MKVICWNVQGVKKAQLHHEVGFINRTIKSNILILLEAMVNGPNGELIIRKLGYHHFSTIPPSNHVGGIWLLWNNENVEVTVLAKESRLMQFLVLNLITSNHCLMSAVYAPTQERHKNEFW